VVALARSATGWMMRNEPGQPGQDVATRIAADDPLREGWAR
jgi:hypothetical protein